MIEGFFTEITEPPEAAGLWVCVSMSDEAFNMLVDGEDVDVIRERLKVAGEIGMINPDRPVLASRINGEIALMQRSFSVN